MKKIVEANLTITIPADQWVQEDEMYRYVYRVMNLTAQHVAIITPASSSKENLMEIAKCMVVSEQSGDAVIFTAATKKPSRTLEFKLQVIGM